MKASAELQMIETPVFKRAWRDSEQNIAEPEYRRRKDESDLKEWLAEQMEKSFGGRTKPFSQGQLVSGLQDQPGVLLVAEALAGRRDFSLEAIIAEALATNSVPSSSHHLYTEEGLAKRAAWEEVWRLQRLEDAGTKVGHIPIPPEYSQGSRGKSTDFLRNEYWQLRGKLDVPKERFIAFTEVPGRAGPETLYGWAGWTPTQRLKALLSIDEELEDAGVSLADRIGLLDSAWRLLPDVAREDEAVAARLKAELQALLGPEGPSREQVEDWRKRFPPPGGRGAKGKKTKQSAEEGPEGEASGD